MKFEQLKLDDYAEIINGGAWSDKEYANNGIPVLKVSNMKNGTIDDSNLSYLPKNLYDKYKKHKVFYNDLLVATVGSHPSQKGSVVGRTSVVPKRLDGVFLNQNAACIRIRALDKVNPIYFIYITKDKSFSDFIENRAKGAANQVRMGIGELKKFPFLFPPLPIQQKIASILIAYDRLIENNLRRIELLEQSAQELYKEWFIRFKFPGHENIQIIDGLPEGWERKSFKDVCQSIGGGTPSTKISSYWDDGDVVWMTPTDLTKNNSIILLDSEKKITEEGLKKSSAKLLPSNTILMTSRASIGYFGLFDGQCSTNQGFISIIPHWDSHKYYLLFNLKNRVQEIISLATGATYKEINKTTFRNMSLIVPHDDLCITFTEYIDPIMDQLRTIKQQNQLLKQARDLLLPRLMKGEIEV